MKNRTHELLEINKYRLITIMVTNGWDQKEVSRRIGYGEYYINNCLTHEHISFDAALKLYVIYGIDPHTYMTDEKTDLYFNQENLHYRPNSDTESNVNQKGKDDSDSGIEDNHALENKSERMQLLVRPEIKCGLGLAASNEDTSINDLVNRILSDYLAVVNDRARRDDLSQK